MSARPSKPAAVPADDWAGPPVPDPFKPLAPGELVATLVGNGSVSESDLPAASRADLAAYRAARSAGSLAPSDDPTLPDEERGRRLLDAYDARRVGVSALVEVASDRDAPAGARVSAAGSLLDRSGIAAPTAAPVTVNLQLAALVAGADELRAKIRGMPAAMLVAPRTVSVQEPAPASDTAQGSDTATQPARS